MNNLFAILVAANLSAPSSEVADDWSIWQFKPSGRGGKTGIFIDSAGRNVAFVDIAGRDLRDLAQDLEEGAPPYFCESSPLTDYQIRKFAFRLASIPDEVVARGSLSITGTCFDEPRIGVSIIKNGRRMYFGYSLEKGCRNGQEVPDWLIGLVNALWARFQDIKACSVTPWATTSTP